MPWYRGSVSEADEEDEAKLSSWLPMRVEDAKVACAVLVPVRDVGEEVVVE